MKKKILVLISAGAALIAAAILAIIFITGNIRQNSNTKNVEKSVLDVIKPHIRMTALAR